MKQAFRLMVVGGLLALSGCTSMTGNQVASLFNDQMTADDRYRYALGLGETGKLAQSRDALQRLLAEARAGNRNEQVARYSWSLAELLKSKKYQAQYPEQSRQAYQQAATLYQDSAKGYQQQGRSDLAASAYVGSANALLLLDQVSLACDDFVQAEQLARTPAVQQSAGWQKLNDSLAFFNDLSTICQVDRLNKQLRREAGLPPQTSP